MPSKQRSFPHHWILDSLGCLQNLAKNRTAWRPNILFNVSCCSGGVGKEAGEMRCLWLGTLDLDLTAKTEIGQDLLKLGLHVLCRQRGDVDGEVYPNGYTVA